VCICVCIPKKKEKKKRDNKTVIANETTGMFMSVGQKLCKKNFTGKKNESGTNILQGHTISKKKKTKTNLSHNQIYKK
jgi:hypothetical protein